MADELRGVGLALGWQVRIPPARERGKGRGKQTVGPAGSFPRFPYDRRSSLRINSDMVGRKCRFARNGLCHCLIASALASSPLLAGCVFDSHRMVLYKLSCVFKEFFFPDRSKVVCGNLSEQIGQSCLN